MRKGSSNIEIYSHRKLSIRRDLSMSLNCSFL
nr:MAG TPA: hypothetical protein [Caudoviricetes sp.]